MKTRKTENERKTEKQEREKENINRAERKERGGQGAPKPRLISASMTNSTSVKRHRWSSCHFPEARGMRAVHSMAQTETQRSREAKELA